jgi:hypothetical protein
MPGVTEPTLLALTIAAVIAFALRAFMANRSGRQLISAFLAAGAWLFFASGVLIWLWRLRSPNTIDPRAWAASGGVNASRRPS